MRIGPSACILVQVTRTVLTPLPEHNGAFNIHIDLRSETQCWWGLLPIRISTPFVIPVGNPLYSNDFEGCFINSGMHQVPLFEGQPPEVVFNAPDPFFVIQTELDRLNHDSVEIVSGQGCAPWLCGGDTRDTTDPGKKHIRLSNGASAIIRLQDGRLEKLAPESMSQNHDIHPQEEALSHLISSFPPATQRNLMSLFKYDATRNISEASLASLLPKNTPQESMMNAINELFDKEGKAMLDARFGV